MRASVVSALAGWIWIALATPQVADAGVVTLCQDDDQPGPGLNLGNALKDGGNITFQCGGPATIRMSRSHEIWRDTTIYGGGRITLDAEGRRLTMFFLAEDGITLSLNDLKVKRARWPQPGPYNLGKWLRGSIVATQYTRGVKVSLSRVTAIENETPIHVESEGELTVSDSEFKDNLGAAITVSGSGSIHESTFVANELAMSVYGKVSVQSSRFWGNTRGAIKVGGGRGRLEVRHSRFWNNSAQRGGAIAISGLAQDVVLYSSHFENNRASEAGGAVAIYAGPATTPRGYRIPPVATSVSLAYTTFAGNQAGSGGAIDADLQPGDRVTIGSGLFNANQAVSGGAIHASGGPITIGGSIFKGNKAQASGSAMHLVGGASDPALIVNSLVFGNEAAQSGGAVAGSPIILKNVTIAHNSGGGLLSQIPAIPGMTVEVWNSIIANNTPVNCSGSAFDFRANNLQFPQDEACGWAAVADPLLDPFYAPLPGSPALGGGDDHTCSAAPVSGRDLFFQRRDRPCAIGAIEFAPEKLAARKARIRQGKRELPEGKKGSDGHRPHDLGPPVTP